MLKWKGDFVARVAAFLLVVNCFACQTQKITLESEAVFIIRVSKKVGVNSIDVSEDFFLLAPKAPSRHRISIHEKEYSVFPLAISHPTGVNLCCADTSIVRVQPKADTEFLSYLDVTDKIDEVDKKRIRVSSEYMVQFFLIEGEYCVCSENYSIVSHKGFSNFSYISKSPIKIDNVSYLWKSMRKEERINLLSLIVPSQ